MYKENNLHVDFFFYLHTYRMDLYEESFLSRQKLLYNLHSSSSADIYIYDTTLNNYVKSFDTFLKLYYFLKQKLTFNFPMKNEIKKIKCVKMSNLEQHDQKSLQCQQ